VIDPEFSFRGHAEFDLGVLLAHLHLADQPKVLRDAALARYRPAPGAIFSLARTEQFAGVEIMRRLIGVAQLPLGTAHDLARKTALLEESRRLVLGSAATA
jgi:5-methylthioribose kinase